jgi:hypothetical protein
MEPKDHDKIAGRWLDAALKQYSNAEPRVGLEGRVSASLRAERESAAKRRNWWPALAAAVAILVVGATIFLVRGRDGARQGVLARYDAPTGTKTSGALSSVRTPALVTASIVPRPRRLVHAARSTRAMETATEPRLAQFPSPQPLSEQEEILANYVAQFQQEAVLVARARTELLERDLAEFEKMPAASGQEPDLEKSRTQ